MFLCYSTYIIENQKILALHSNQFRRYGHFYNMGISLSFLNLSRSCIADFQLYTPITWLILWQKIAPDFQLRLKFTKFVQFWSQHWSRSYTFQDTASRTRFGWWRTYIWSHVGSIFCLDRIFQIGLYWIFLLQNSAFLLNSFIEMETNTMLVSVGSDFDCFLLESNLWTVWRWTLGTIPSLLLGL